MWLKTVFSMLIQERRQLIVLGKGKPINVSFIAACAMIPLALKLAWCWLFATQYFLKKMHNIMFTFVFDLLHFHNIGGNGRKPGVNLSRTSSLENSCFLVRFSISHTVTLVLFILFSSKTGLVTTAWDRLYFFTQGGNLMCQPRGAVAGGMVLDLDNSSVMAVDCEDRRYCFQITSPSGKT